MITVNFDKAKDITKARLRLERVALFERQDILYMQALESQQDVTAIIAEKQRLRDLPALADGCNSLEELKALKP